MTRQQLFSKVARHLLRQNCQSLSPSRTCMYRGERGRKCAIGVLIPDTKYRQEFEGKSLREDHTESIQKAAGISNAQIALAQTLQTVHDNHPVHTWRENLQNIAAQYRLKMPRVKVA